MNPPVRRTRILPIVTDATRSIAAALLCAALLTIPSAATAGDDAFPEQTRPFQENRKTDLVAVFGTYEARADLPGRISAVAVSPDGTEVTAGRGDWRTIVWNIAENRRRLEVVRDQQSTEFLTWSPTGQALVSRSDTGHLELHDAEAGDDASSLPTAATTRVKTLAFSPDGKLLATGHWFGTVRVTDIARGTVIRTFKRAHSGHVTAVTFLGNGQLVSAGGDRGGPSLKVWDVATGRRVSKSAWKKGSTQSCLAFSPDRSRAALAGIGYLFVWDCESGRAVHELGSPLRGASFSAAAFSPDGKTLVGCVDAAGTGPIKVYDATTGAELDTIDLGLSDDAGTAVAFHPDGSSFFVGTARGVVLQFALRP